VPTAQTLWETAKGGWAMFRGLFSEKYREETYSNPPVTVLKTPEEKGLWNRFKSLFD
jgi:hypothetical protein